MIPDLRRRLGDPQQHRLVDRVAAGRLLERGRVRVGDLVEVMLPLDVRERARAPSARRARRQLERRLEHRDLELVDGNLQRDAVGQLGEPADVADDERLAERERADHRAGRLAHRREAQVHETSHAAISDHIRSSGTYLETLDALREPEPLEPAVEVEALAGGADEQQPRAGPPRRSEANASSSCGIRLFMFRRPKQPISGSPPTSAAGATSAGGHAGCGIRQSGPS